MSEPEPSGDETLLRAFPSEVRAVAEQVIAGLPVADYPPVGDVSQSNHKQWDGITVHGQPVAIPARIYNPPTDGVRGKAGAETVRACLYSRHHNGHVRQAALPTLLRSEAWWAIPFVVQLLGEYVIEICDDIAAYTAGELPQHPAFEAEFQSFCADNPAFIALTEARARSYWAEYYRREHLWPHTYPALVALARLAKPRLER